MSYFLNAYKSTVILCKNMVIVPGPWPRTAEIANYNVKLKKYSWRLSLNPTITQIPKLLWFERFWWFHGSWRPCFKQCWCRGHFGAGLWRLWPCWSLDIYPKTIIGKGESYGKGNYIILMDVVGRIIAQMVLSMVVQKMNCLAFMAWVNKNSRKLGRKGDRMPLRYL